MRLAAACGTLGMLIPPSVPLVIYAILAERNSAKLFAAGTAQLLPNFAFAAAMHLPLASPVIASHFSVASL